MRFDSPWLSVFAALGFVVVVAAAISLVLDFVARGSGVRGWLLSRHVSDESRHQTKNGVALLLAGLLLPLAILGAWPDHFDSVLRAFNAIATVVLAVGIWSIAVDLIAKETALHSSRPSSVIVPFLRQFGKIIIWAIGIAVALSALGLDVQAVFAGLGLGGIAIALASKDSIENFFGALTVVIDVPFGVGDWIRVDKAEGVVEDIRLRSTLIRTFDDSLITLPNSNLIKATVENMGTRRVRRIKTTFNLLPPEDAGRIETFLASIRDKINALGAVVDDRTRVHLYDLRPEGAVIQIVLFLDVADIYEEEQVREQVMLILLNEAKAAGLTLAVRTTL